MGTETVLEFANPERLFLLFFVPVVLFFLLFYSLRSDKQVAPRFKAEYSAKIYASLAVLWAVFIGGLAVYAAGPQFNAYGHVEDNTRGEYVVLIDTSLSMDARPSPLLNSRMDEGKRVVSEVLESLPSRFVIFGFSGMAEPLSNFTDDRSHLSDVLSHGVYTGVIPVSGSELVHALARVVHEKENNPEYANVEHIILISDGDIGIKYGDRLDEAISLVNGANLSVVAVGVGSGGPENIPVFNDAGRFTGNYLVVDDTGEIYIDQLQENNLRIVARATGGEYFYQDNSNELIRFLEATLPKALEIEEAEEVLHSRDIGWIILIPVTIALCFILLFIRRFYY